MRFKNYLHDFVRYFLSLLSTLHSSQMFLCQSKPNLHLQHKACNQFFTHRMSSFLLSLFQLGPSHPYFIPELFSHSRNTFGHYPWGPHQRAANGIAPKAGQALQPSSATRNLSRHQVRLGDCCLRFLREGVSWRCHRHFLLQGGTIEHRSLWKIPKCVFFPHHFAGDGTCSEVKVQRGAEAFFLLPKLTIFQPSSPWFVLLWSPSALPSLLCAAEALDSMRQAPTTQHWKQIHSGFPCTSWAGFLGISPNALLSFLTWTMQEVTQSVGPGCEDGHHILLMSTRSVQTHLSSSAQHYMQISLCHAFKGIYHPPKCIHQAKMPLCDHCGSTGTTLAGLEHAKAPHGPNMDWLRIPSHGLKSGGSQAAWEISSKVREQRRNIEAQQCSSAAWKRKKWCVLTNGIHLLSRQGLQGWEELGLLSVWLKTLSQDCPRPLVQACRGLFQQLVWVFCPQLHAPVP